MSIKFSQQRLFLFQHNPCSTVQIFIRRIQWIKSPRPNHASATLFIRVHPLISFFHLYVGILRSSEPSVSDRFFGISIARKKKRFPCNGRSDTIVSVLLVNKIAQRQRRRKRRNGLLVSSCRCARLYLGKTNAICLLGSLPVCVTLMLLTCLQ